MHTCREDKGRMANVALAVVPGPRRPRRLIPSPRSALSTSPWDPSIGRCAHLGTVGMQAMTATETSPAAVSCCSPTATVQAKFCLVRQHCIACTHMKWLESGAVWRRSGALCNSTRSPLCEQRSYKPHQTGRRLFSPAVCGSRTQNSAGKAPLAAAVVPLLLLPTPQSKCQGEAAVAEQTVPLFGPGVHVLQG